jgi:hypothetical protein
METLLALIGVPRRAMKLVHHLRDFQYEDRLRALHLTMLETRWRRGDLIEVYSKYLEDWTN